MKKQKILFILALLTWLTWLTTTEANLKYIENKANDYEIVKWEEIQLQTINQDNTSINFYKVNKLLNNVLQNNIYWYFKNELSLTNLKKTFKKNLQARKKIQKELIEVYNLNFNNKYLNLISTNWIQISEVEKIKSIFFTKSSSYLS